MGHRKYSAPRRGSIAFRPRARAKSLEARIRTWPQLAADRGSLLGFAGFKAGGINILTIDDREKTPNFGKQLLNAATVIVTPPIRIIGIRGYRRDMYGLHAIFDVYAKDLPKELSRKFDAKNKDEAFSKAESLLDRASEIVAIVAVSPYSIGLSQKVPFVFEIAVSGKDVRSQYDYVKSILGRELRIS
ncbi:MAG: 50S ribosomal protein L3, partial [Thermoproteota archaeon]|nr:50S ribosomal protein L3 [Thermoproteota archaeon]